MWRKTIHIDHAIEPLSGNDDRPWLMLGDDGNRYVVKFRRNDDQPTIINEIFANKLATSLGLPVSEMVLVDIGVHITNNANLKERKIVSGTHIATRYLKNAVSLQSMGLNSIPKNRISNLNLVPKFIIFDIMLYNIDRHPGNILMSRDNDDYSYCLIDHGRIFNGCKWDEKLQGLQYKRKSFGWDMSEARDISQYRDFIDMVKSLTEQVYWDALNHIPDEFKLRRSNPQFVIDKLITDDQSRILRLLDDVVGGDTL